ncbi:MAG: hypothetical protein FWD48_03980 [Oscillospiraceae bacterium]|nr:hypothetical protein [Oscillospiraceae bacterium]
MLISKAEMDVLRIVGAHKDAPAEIIKNVLGEFLDDMLERGYLKSTRENTNLRLTNAGVKLLLEAGTKAKTGTRVIGRTLERRHQGAQVSIFLCELGIDVFLKDVIKEVIVNPAYLSSAEMRRQGYKNMVGMSKFNGLLYSNKVTYAVYNVSDTSEKFYPLTDESVFKCEIIRAHVPAEIMYIADCSLKEMAETYVNRPPAEIIENASPAADFYQAIELFTAPVYLVPADSIGRAQLQIMLTENYKEKLARYMIDATFREPPANYLDAVFDENKHLIIFIDFDVKRLEKAIRLTENLHILVLTEQEDALRALLNGRSAAIYSIDTNEVLNDVLQIPPLENRRLEQFRNEKGDGVLAEKFNRNDN